MAEFVNRNDCEILVDVFLISGAVDLSDALTDTLHFDLEDYLSRRNAQLKILLDHPFVQHVFVFPLTPRRICRNKLSDTFPKYAKHTWILKANQCIHDVNQSNINFHTKLRYVPALPTNQMLPLISKDGIHLEPEGKESYAWSVLQVCEKKIFPKDEFPPLKHSKNETSPLQSVDMLIANFEAKKRDEKKKKELAILIDTQSDKIDKDIFFEKRRHIECPPLSKERKMQKFKDVSIKVVQEQKKKKRRKEKDAELQKSFDCLPVDAFINPNQSKKSKNGEEKQIDRLVKNILRQRLAKNLPLLHPWTFLIVIIFHQKSRYILIVSTVSTVMGVIYPPFTILLVILILTHRIHCPPGWAGAVTQEPLANQRCYRPTNCPADQQVERPTEQLFQLRVRN